MTEANDALPADDPRKLDDAALAASIDRAIDDAGRRNEQLSLTQLAAVAPDVIDQASRGRTDPHGRLEPVSTRAKPARPKPPPPPRCSNGHVHDGQRVSSS